MVLTTNFDIISPYVCMLLTRSGEILSSSQQYHTYPFYQARLPVPYTQRIGDYLAPDYIT
jgi:hypothetical protein